MVIQCIPCRFGEYGDCIDLIFGKRDLRDRFCESFGENTENVLNDIHKFVCRYGSRYEITEIQIDGQEVTVGIEVGKMHIYKTYKLNE